MSTTNLEQRLSAVEQELARLKAQIEAAPKRRNNWVEKIAGTFANDPLFDDAMRLGRQWRESQRPKARRARPASRPSRTGKSPK